MTTSLRIRYGALAATAALIAGGLFAAVPANAAQEGTLTVTPEVISGDATGWGDGFTVTGSGFTPDSTLDLDLEGPDSASLETFPVTVDGTGAFSAEIDPTVAFPALLPRETLTIAVTDSSDGDSANPVTITQLAPTGIRTSVSTISTEDLAAGTPIDVNACGYVPGETITTTVDYSGQTFDISESSHVADEAGCIALSIELQAGTAVAGEIVVHVAGATLTQDATVTVTGSPTEVPGGDPGTPPAVGTGSATGAVTPYLPVVSG